MSSEVGDEARHEGGVVKAVVDGVEEIHQMAVIELSKEGDLGRLGH